MSVSPANRVLTFAGALWLLAPGSLPLAGSDPTVTGLFDLYDRGAYAAVDQALLESPKTPLARAYRRESSRWIDAAPAEARDRRRLVAGAVALEIVGAGLEAEWADVHEAIEEACAYVRAAGPHSNAERLWQQSAIALFHGGGGAYTIGDVARDHRYHLSKRAPTPRLRLGIAIDDERRIRVPLDQLVSGGRGTSVSPSRLYTTVVLPVVEQYESLVNLPEVDADARLRLAHLLVRLNRADEAIPHLRAASSAPDPYVVHIAEFLTGQIGQARGDTTGAAAAYQRALRAMPGAMSASLALSVTMADAGDLTGAQTLVSLTAVQTAPVDPWRVFALGDYRWWPQWRGDLRESLRR